MPRTKKKPSPQNLTPQSTGMNGPPGEVLTLSETAAYLRLAESEVLRLIHEQRLPARRVGSEWRFFKAAVQEWLSQPIPSPSKEAQLASAGAFKDDPDLEAIVEEIYRRRGRPITEDGSYNLFHGLTRE